MRWLSRWLLRATGPVVLVFLLVRVVDYSELRDIVQDIDVLWALLALAMVQVLMLTRTFRWIDIHQTFGLRRASFGYQLRLSYATMLATLVLPQIVNPFSRFVLLLQDGYPAKRAGAASVLEKLLDLVAFVTFGLYGSIFLASTFGGFAWWAIGAIALALGLSLAAYALRSYLGRLASLFLPKLPGMSGEAADGAVGLLRQFGVLNPRIVVRLIASSLIVALAQATLFYLLARSLHVDLSYPFMVAVWGMVALTMLLPLSVNGIGTREAVLVVAFSAADRSTDAAVALGLLVFVVVAIGSSPGAIEWLRRFFVSRSPAGTQEAAPVAMASRPQGERSR